MWGHCVDEPDSVVRLEKDVPGGVHGGCVHVQDDRAAVASADAAGRLGVSREVHVLAPHLPQPLGRNAGRGAFVRPVVQHGRWLDRLQLQVDGNAVALTGTDARARCIKAEALLVVRGDHLVELVAGDRFAVARDGRQQLRNVDPPAWLER